MDRCHGKTKSGERCKRPVREGSRFCAIHAGQAEGPGEADTPGDTSQAPGSQDTLLLMAAAGMALLAVLAVRRLFRFF